MEVSKLLLENLLLNLNEKSYRADNVQRFSSFFVPILISQILVTRFHGGVVILPPIL